MQLTRSKGGRKGDPPVSHRALVLGARHVGDHDPRERLWAGHETRTEAARLDLTRSLAYLSIADLEAMGPLAGRDFSARRRSLIAGGGWTEPVPACCGCVPRGGMTLVAQPVTRTPRVQREIEFEQI